jgi:hypothetical protein
MVAAYVGASFGTVEMTDPLLTLVSDDIQIDQTGLEAIATFVFPDGMRFPVHVTRHTLNNWLGHSNARDIRAAVLRRSATLARIAWSGRTDERRRIKI